MMGMLLTSPHSTSNRKNIHCIPFGGGRGQDAGRARCKEAVGCTAHTLTGYHSPHGCGWSVDRTFSGWLASVLFCKICVV
ncbi:hypothetical protein V7x_48430 [Crateriforma conspicua]|uniref:Uncharacterized protein n=1 Tax=Crateriforma conspicua TaxID=2527996 RepID=A0A5C6FLT2_9PLAN|nr:hypothetical protein V7x_48430 [Crateriforma conspicua]